ncbi:MAG: prephenate dehydratase domain-containing protein [Peptoniphilus sp.]|nr:prephenate dehydratase domain-containing protein [Peptoniphilus sp.]
MDLKELREQINEIDKNILEAFTERMEVSREIAKVKKEKGLSLENKVREREILDGITEKTGDLSHYARLLYSTLFDLSKSYQSQFLFTEGEFERQLQKAAENTPKIFPKKAKIAVQGREGSYSQQASDHLFSQGKLLYFHTFEEVFDAVEREICDYGVLPLENSSKGSVKEVYDLMERKQFFIVASYRLLIHHALMAKKGVAEEELREIISHAQALEQCSEYLRSIENVKVGSVENTAVAAKIVSESPSREIGAISSSHCADLYGLEVLKEGIQNSDNNYTRFICISKKMEIYPGASKISFRTTAKHEPGGLYKIIAQFAALGLNLTKIESRPIIGKDFEFLFYFDFEGSVHMPEVLGLLSALKRENKKFVFLGNYLER